ncbi:MAG TPA: hypothetical protein VHD33_02975, partial [Legionellaceae bacterium]|nr:hypothetical protein [Legionellaceae bacterium]
MRAINFFRHIISSLLLFLCTQACIAGNVVYTQLYSLQNQAAVAEVNLATLDIIDGIQNIGTAPTNITVQKPGFYFILAVGQAGAVRPATIDGNQYVDIW